MNRKQAVSEADEKTLFKFDKPKAIAGYAYVGAWLGLAALGAMVGMLLASHD